MKRITPRRIAALMVLLGLALICAGVALIYVPAALIVAGLVLGGLGVEELRGKP